MATSKPLPWRERARALMARVLARMKTAGRPEVLHLHGHGGAMAREIDAAVAAFGQWCGRHEGAVCELTLSGQWLLTMAAPPTLRGAELQSEVTQRWAHYQDVDEAALAADWVYRQAHDRHVALGCAVPRALIEGLRAQAVRHGVDLRAVRPWWGRAVQRWLAEQAALPAAARSDEIKLALIEPGLIMHVQVTRDEAHGLHVTALWSEAGVPASFEKTGASGLTGDAIRLPAPAMPVLAGERHMPHAWPMLWDHAELQPIVNGESAAMGVGVADALDASSAPGASAWPGARA